MLDHYNRSLRRKAYSNIYRELKCQFGVTTYKAIKRSQCDLAIPVIQQWIFLCLDLFTENVRRGKNERKQH